MNERRIGCAFVTGGAGFIGSYLLRELIAAGIAVRALVRTLPVPQEMQLPVQWIEGDLLEPAGWQAALNGCDVVFHLAAAYSWRTEEAATLYRINAGGTRALLQAAAACGVSLVVHTSTIGTIGQPADGSPGSEDTPFTLWPTASAYVRSKWLAEAVALWAGQRGLPVVVVNPTAPVGAGDRKPTATGQRIVDFLAGRRSAYPAGGINFCPAGDIAAGHLLAARRGQAGRRYILGHAAGNLSEAAFLQLMAETSGLPVPAAQSVRGGRAPQSLTADPRRAIRELGMPQSDLRAAFAQAIAFSP